MNENQQATNTRLATVGPRSAGAVLAAMHGGDGAPIELPKPYANRICLIPDARVAGTTHVPDIERHAEALHEGDELRLERDTVNRYDRWAIRVLNSQGAKLGFIPADQNEIIARLMDGGKRIIAKVTGVEHIDGWHKIGIEVWLDD